MHEDYLWIEKYRPKKVADAILPTALKKKMEGYVNEKNIPHLLLSGPPGIGKTSCLRAILDQLQADYKFYNGSLEGRSIDTLRTDIFNYVSSVSFSGGRKYVLLDEADNLNPNSFQPALRSFMDTYGNNTGFLFTCNYPSKIIEPLHSRCVKIDFKIDAKEKINLAYAFLNRCIDILRQEKIGYDDAVLAKVIEKYFPDWRRILNELQGYSVSGTIDAGILQSFQEISLKKLFGYLKNKNFTEMRKWVAENTIEAHDFYTNLYEHLPSQLTVVGQSMAIILLGEYHYECAFCTNQEINFTACLTDLMTRLNGEWL